MTHWRLDGMDAVSKHSVLATRLGTISSRTWGLYVTSFAIGLIAGALAFVLKKMIAATSLLVTHGLEVSKGNLVLISLPVIGILLAVIFQRYCIRRNISHGVEQLQKSLNKQDYSLSPKLLYSPMIANTFSLGFGGSAGAEGPIAYTGAAVGSNLGRILGFSGKDLMLLVACGAGAGIAGIFTAPIGGVLFSVEILQVAFTTTGVIALVIACATAGLTVFACAGFKANIDFTYHMPFEPWVLIWVIILGIFCGLFSAYYIIIMNTVRRYLTAIGNHWIKNILAGLTIGVLVFFFPSLYGEGYDIISDIINNHYDAIVDNGPFYAATQNPGMLVLYALGIMMFKAFATSSTNSGGGVAGDFAPTLFAGSVVGLVFALGLNTLFGLDLPVGTLAFIAMAGVMSGAVKAPLMAMFLVAETTGVIDMLLPLAIVSTISYGVTKLLKQ